jgi:hypothetical protein
LDTPTLSLKTFYVASPVSLRRGTIWVESQLGQESTFHFTAVFEVEDADVEPPRSGWQSLTDLPVLIVDDNATNRRILEEVLKNWHMDPGSVVDGAAALGALDKSMADYPKRLGEIRVAIQFGDAERLRLAAHALKGSVGNFAAKRVIRDCPAARDPGERQQR